MTAEKQNRESLETSCCIAGGGPAGVLLGYLLARKGIDVLILEKHADFFRDFRGDTIHPSTLELMQELGLLEEFLKLPHQEVRQMKFFFEGQAVTVADFSSLRMRCPFIALMPQWDFLDFMAQQASRYSAFHLKMSAEVVDLLKADHEIVGVKVKTPQGDLEVSSDVVIGADGRHSIVREKAGLEVMEQGVPIDVVWFRLSRSSTDPEQSGGYFKGDKMMIMLDRENYWQCGIVIPKGRFAEIQKEGLESFRKAVAALVPFMQDRVGELKDWHRVKLLTVKIDRLREWYRPGLLCIGDAAHAMSPVGGIGINIAIQDAVAAANILTPRLYHGSVPLRDLKKVQTRRERAVRITQALQAFLQRRLFKSMLGRRTSPPLFFSLLGRVSFFRRWMAAAIGVGFQPEHLRN